MHGLVCQSCAKDFSLRQWYRMDSSVQERKNVTCGSEEDTSLRLRTVSRIITGPMKVENVEIWLSVIGWFCAAVTPTAFRSLMDNLHFQNHSEDTGHAGDLKSKIAPVARNIMKRSVEPRMYWTSKDLEHFLSFQCKERPLPTFGRIKQKRVTS